jgi:hypothetical protein
MAQASRSVGIRPLKSRVLITVSGERNSCAARTHVHEW